MVWDVHSPQVPCLLFFSQPYDSLCSGLDGSCISHPSAWQQANGQSLYAPPRARLPHRGWLPASSALDQQDLSLSSGVPLQRLIEYSQGADVEAAVALICPPGQRCAIGLCKAVCERSYLRGGK